MIDTKSIKQRSDIVDVISDFITVKKKGAGHVAICPFHDDTDPSLYINQAKQTYTCFVCGAHGDVFQFIQEFNKSSFPEALKHVANKYGIDINPEYSAEERKKIADRNEGLEKIDKMQKAFVNNLLNTKEALNYISTERGFSELTIKKFGIGYSSMGFYAGRITFPYQNYSNNIVGHSGRILKFDKSNKEIPKYKNSSENEFFKKGDLLFGFIQARHEIAKKNLAYFVEGPTDVMMFNQSGIENTIAGSGTALTINQARKIRTICDNIILIYDGDNAGQKAAFKNIKVLLPTGLNIYIVNLPEGEDPDSFSKKNKKEFILNFLSENRISWIEYFIKSKSELLADVQQKSIVASDFIELASEITDVAKMTDVIRSFCVKTNIDYDLIKSKINIKKTETNSNNTLFVGLQLAKDKIIEHDNINICENKKQLIDLLGKGYENIICLPENLSNIENEIKSISSLSKNITLLFDADLAEKEDIKFYEFCNLDLTKIGILLFKSKFNVQIMLGNDTESFLNFYCESKTRSKYYGNDLEQRQTIEEMAELISLMDETLQTLKIPEIAKILRIKETAFRKVIKPFENKNKSKIRQANERVIIDEVTHIFDINNLPDYVDDMFFRKYRFFEAQNKNGDKIFYVFQTAENTLMKVANFHMTPLFHVYSEDSGKNKRILSVRHESYPSARYIEVRSADMLNFLKFKEFMFNLGGYLFTNGKPFQYEKILESTALDYPVCKELLIYGLHPDGFYAFPNGILTSDNEFIGVNDLGLIEYKTDWYYSPSFSKIWEESDRFETIKMFAYKESNISFNEWASLMHKVYKYNLNGMWAILAVMLAANREYIFNIDRLFTTLFFIGPTDSGKSQIGISIRSVFIREAAPLFNLTSGTDAAFFSIMGSYKDVALVFDEYNDVTVSDNKFQGLKACIYDGEGKTKRADATSETLVTTIVNIMPILLGQQSPERDDNALNNRVVVRHVQKKDNWVEEEEKIYKELKKYEKQGLSNVLVEILKCKKIIHKYYPGTIKIVRNDLRDYCRDNNLQYQTRIINTVSLFLTMAKVVSQYCSDILLPFSYEDFFQECVAQVQKQSHDVSSTNSLALFFNAIQSLLNNKKVVRGRDFDIVIENSVTVTVDDVKTESKVFKEPKKVLYLRVKQIHPEYANFVKKDYMKLNQLNVNIHDHKAFLGKCKSHRFKWTERTDIYDPMEQRVKPVINNYEQNSSSVLLDYKILQETADIDFEENMTEIEKPFSPQTLFKESEPESKLPF